MKPEHMKTSTIVMRLAQLAATKCDAALWQDILAEHAALARELDLRIPAPTPSQLAARRTDAEHRKQQKAALRGRGGYHW